jgi:hypothetical protein
MIPLLLAWCSWGEEPPVRLDLGPQHGAVLAGFSEATAWRVADPRVTWLRAPGPARDAGWPDPLLRDGYADGALKVQIPPGTYTVAVLIDDLDYGLRPPVGSETGVMLQGERTLLSKMPEGPSFFATRWHGHSADASFGPDVTSFDRHVARAAPWRVTTVAVGPDGLTVEPFGGSPLSGLVISAESQAALEVELALIDVQRRTWMVDHRPDTAIPDLPVLQPGPIQVEALSWDNLPSSKPVTANAPSKAAAPGQRLTWLFALHGAEPTTQLKVDGLDLLDAQLFEVRWADVAENHITRARPWHLVPVPDGRLRPGQGLVPMVAITARVPPGINPQSFVGSLNITGSGAATSVALPVRVRALHLEPPASKFGVWADLRAHVAKVYGQDDPRTRAVWARDVAMLREHDVDILNLRGAFFPGSPSPDHLETFRWATDAWRKAGGGPVTWVDAGSALGWGRADPRIPVFDDASAEKYRQWLRAARELDVELYIDDEHVLMQGPARIPFLRRYLAAVAELNVGIDARLSLAEGHPGAWETVRGNVDTNYLAAYPWVDLERLAWWEGSGTQAVLYNLGLQREHTSIMPWAMESEAVVLWHYNEPYADPFNGVRRLQWQMSLLAPDGETVWSTSRLERLAEGAQDQRYLSTASALVRELENHRSPKVQSAIEDVCRLLRVARQSTLGQRPNQNRDHGLVSERSLEALQYELGNAAESLAVWSKRQRMRARGKNPGPGISGFFPDRCDIHDPVPAPTTP